jgi:hypothetical protein
VPLGLGVVIVLVLLIALQITGKLSFFQSEQTVVVDSSGATSAKIQPTGSLLMSGYTEDLIKLSPENSGIFLLNLADGTVDQLFDDERYSRTSPSFSDDFTKVVYSM